jgi:hypothetical protein
MSGHSRKNAAEQQSFWTDDDDDRFNRAVRGGWLVNIISVAGRRVLNATDPQEYEEAIELLRDTLPEPPADYDPVPFIEANNWTFAKTRPESPHFYVLLRNTSDWREHLRFLRWLRVYGEARKWRDGRTYIYRVVDGWNYWAMGPSDTILNRSREW